MNKNGLHPTLIAVSILILEVSFFASSIGQDLREKVFRVQG
jgi:hypothetical protein